MFTSDTPKIGPLGEKRVKYSNIFQGPALKEKRRKLEHSVV
jgi:hypothetical protein